MVNEKIFETKAERFGWKDFILNAMFSLIMIVSIIVVIIYTPPTTITNWGLAILTTLLPLLIFANRTVKELFYTKDYIRIEKDRIYYRSTPLLTTGFLKTKKGDVSIREIRKFGLAKIPRKLSLDLRKQKNKGILVISLRNGKEVFIGEYISNEKLFEICKLIPELYPKARLSNSSLQQFPELSKYKPSTKVPKKSKRKEDDDIEGAEIRL
ncbi:MAG: hypothetical protein ACTSYD_09790 [Candidatus Heimdallarchaeaceae archaeon]